MSFGTIHYSMIILCILVLLCMNFGISLSQFAQLNDNQLHNKNLVCRRTARCQVICRVYLGHILAFKIVFKNQKLLTNNWKYVPMCLQYLSIPSTLCNWYKLPKKSSMSILEENLWRTTKLRMKNILIEIDFIAGLIKICW